MRRKRPESKYSISFCIYECHSLLGLLVGLVETFIDPLNDNTYIFLIIGLYVVSLWAFKRPKYITHFCSIL